MSAVSAAQPSSSLRPSPRRNHRLRLPTISLSMKDGTKTTAPPTELKIEAVPVPKPKTGSDQLRFDRLQRAEDELLCRHKREFGRFFAREAQIDEEYWTAAWLRAESHWEGKPNMRHADSFKRQFAEREFIALKRRCNSQLADRSTCIIAMKRKEMNVKQTVLSSIVGTLDLSIRHRICTGVFPEETSNSPVFSGTYNTDHPKFGYVANLCVSKYARRQGIASNMLQLAVEAAKAYGVDRVLVHVRKDNTGARKLYDNLGFQKTAELQPAGQRSCPSRASEKPCNEVREGEAAKPSWERASATDQISLEKSREEKPATTIQHREEQQSSGRSAATQRSGQRSSGRRKQRSRAKIVREGCFGALFRGLIRG